MSEQLHPHNPIEANEEFVRQVFSSHIRAIAFGEISDGSNTFDLGRREAADNKADPKSAGLAYSPSPTASDNADFDGTAIATSEVPEKELSDEEFDETDLNHLQTQALLCSTLARLFAYPNKQNAADFSNGEALDYLEYLIRQAGLLCTESKPLLPAARQFSEEPDEVRALRIRAEFTRLFFQHQAPIRLEGHVWLTVSDRTEEARVLGEAAAVNAFYRRFGMQAKQGTAADNLSTELDFLARLIRLEEDSRQQGESGDASSWKQARLDFLRQHLGPFATRVCTAIRATETNPLLQYEAALLLEVLEYCS